MTRATKGDPLDVVPEFSPVAPDVAVTSIARLEVHRVEKDERGQREYVAVVHEFEPHAGLTEIKEVAGGGTYRIVPKDAKGKALANITRRIAGKPLEMDDDEEDDEDDPSDALAKTLKSLGGFLSAMNGGGGGGGNAAAMVAQQMSMMQQMQMQASMNATQIQTMQTAHASEVQRYRDRVGDLEKRVGELEKENAGMLQKIAKDEHVAASNGGTIGQLLQAAPHLPDIAKAFFGGIKGMGAPDAAAGAAAQAAPRLVLPGPKT